MERIPLDYGVRRISGKAAVTIADMPRFDGRSLMDSYDDLTWSWFGTPAPDQRAQIKKACRRVTHVMNALKQKGLLDPTPRRMEFTCPRSWPARIELDRASGTYSVVEMD